MQKVIFYFMLRFFQVYSHGHMVEPVSRQQLARDNGVYGSTKDDCPHCVLAAPLLAEGNGAESRSYPGNRAFSEPGTASSVDFFMNGESPFGVCGTQKFGSNDYNYHNAAGLWGEDVIVAEYTAGEVIDVEWCVNADHGGVYSWRLCDDPRIVEKFWRDYPLSVDEQLEAEECFQRGNLRCDDVNENSCNLEPDCKSDYGCAADPGKYFHCEGTYPNTKSYSCQNTGDFCDYPQGSYLVKRKVRIPFNFTEGKTIMSWRWDSHETTEIFAACADIYIKNDGVTKAPTVSKAPTPATSSPTSKPTRGSVVAGLGYCCWWSPFSDMCSDCQSSSEADSWCGESEDRCNTCGGTWCAGEDSEETSVPSAKPTPMPTSEPTYAPTPEPTSEETAEPTSESVDPSGLCCWWSPESDMCSDCQSFSEPSSWCGESRERCDRCGGTWC